MPTQHGSDNVTSGIVDFMVKFRELSTYDSSSMLNSFWSTDRISRPGAEDDIEADEAVTNCHRRSSTISPGFAEIRREGHGKYESFTECTEHLSTD